MALKTGKTGQKKTYPVNLNPPLIVPPPVVSAVPAVSKGPGCLSSLGSGCFPTIRAAVVVSPNLCSCGLAVSGPASHNHDGSHTPWSELCSKPHSLCHYVHINLLTGHQKLIIIFDGRAIYELAWVNMRGSCQEANACRCQWRPKRSYLCVHTTLQTGPVVLFRLFGFAKYARPSSFSAKDRHQARLWPRLLRDLRLHIWGCDDSARPRAWLLIQACFWARRRVIFDSPPCMSHGC